MFLNQLLMIGDWLIWFDWSINMGLKIIDVQFDDWGHKIAKQVANTIANVKIARHGHNLQTQLQILKLQNMVTICKHNCNY